jgi:hypothetical protein
MGKCSAGQMLYWTEVAFLNALLAKFVQNKCCIRQMLCLTILAFLNALLAKCFAKLVLHQTNVVLVKTDMTKC